MSEKKTYGTRAKAAPINHQVYDAYLSRLSLSTDHFNALRNRGLTAEQISAARYMSKPGNKTEAGIKAVLGLANDFNLEGIPGFHVDEKTGHWTSFIVQGVALPVRDFEGNIASILLRNDKPREKNGKIENKYVAFSTAGKLKGAKVYQTIHCPILTGKAKEISGVEIRITEGVLKADVATALGKFYCIGLQGLKVTDDFEVILAELEISRLRIALDQGEDDNADIIRTRAELIQKARKFGIEVAVEVWDAKFGKGIDDVLQGGHEDQIREATDEEIDAFLELSNIKNPLNGEWVYVVATERFVNINTFQELKKSQFADKFCLEKTENVNKLIASGFRQVDSMTFLPGGERFVLEGAGHSCLNTWRDPKVTPAEGDVTPFLKHLEYLFSSQEERDILLDWMAYNVQHPGSKILWAIVIKGDEGVGKSYFADVMRSLVGKENVSTPTNEQIHEPYTDWQKACQLVVVEEIMMKGRLDMMNKLKTVITQEITNIREMFKPTYSQPNRFNIIMFTNHDDALLIDNKDRRYCFLRTDAKLTNIEYYESLWEWTRKTSSIQALLAYMLQRDLSKFNPKAKAPMTEAKKDLIKISRSSLEEWIATGIEDESFPFNSDLIAVRHLRSRKICPPGLDKYSDHKFADALRKCGAVQYPTRIILADKSKATLWILRRPDMWKNESPEMVRRQYEKHNLDIEPGNPIEDGMPV